MNGSVSVHYGGRRRTLGTLALILVLAMVTLIQAAGMSPGLAAAGGDGHSQAVGTPSSAGDLDTTFSGDGKLTTSFTSNDDWGLGAAVQADGKIVAAGVAGGTGSNPNFALSRYNSDGSLDTTFSGDGKVKTDVAGSRPDGSNDVAIQGDGKIVAAGGMWSSDTNEKFALVRYNTDGSLDTTFSGDGMVTANFTAGRDSAFGVAIQADWKITAAGVSDWDAAGADFALARFNSDGTLDDSFAGDGKLTTSFTSKWDAAYDVALQADGKIVAGGESGYGGSSNPKVAVARYNTDGTLDTTFSGDGKVNADLTSTEDWANGIAVQGDGKIVGAGEAGNGGAADFGLVRFNSDGTLDHSFDGDGKLTTSFTTNWDAASDVALQADGKIVAAGESGYSASGNPKVAVARYNTDGTPDTSFSGDGKVNADLTPLEDLATAVVIQADGKIVAAGGAGFGGDTDFALVRFLAA